MRMVVRMEIEMGMGMGMGMELRLRIITMMMILKGDSGVSGHDVNGDDDALATSNARTTTPFRLPLLLGPHKGTRKRIHLENRPICCLLCIATVCRSSETEKRSTPQSRGRKLPVASCKLPAASCNCNCCRCLPVDHPLRLPLQLQLPAIVIHKCEFNLKIALILLGCRHLCIAEKTKLHPISIYNRQIRISYKFFAPHKMSGKKSKGKSLAIHFFALTF